MAFCGAKNFFCIHIKLIYRIVQNASVKDQFKFLRPVKANLERTRYLYHLSKDRYGLRENQNEFFPGDPFPDVTHLTTTEQ